MTGPFGLLLMVVAGACTLPVLVHASLWVRDRSDLRQLWYAMMGLGAFGYVTCTSLLYAAPDLETYRYVLRIQTWTTPLFLVGLVGVARDMSGDNRAGRFERVLVALLVVQPFVRLSDPWTYVFTQVRGLTERVLPWGERIAILDAESSLAGSVFLTSLFLGVIVLMVGRSWRAWTSRGHREALVLCVVSSLLLTSAIVDTVIVLRMLPLPWLTEPVMGVVVLMLAWKMQSDVAHTARLRMDLEANQSMLAALVEHATDLVARLDSRGVVTWASHSVAAFAGLLPGEVAGRHWTWMVQQEDQKKVEEGFLRLHAGEDVVRVSFRIRTEGREGQWVETIARALRHPDGSILEIQCVTRDVDEARRRELRLLTLEQELRETNAGLERRVQERTEDLRRTIRDLESFAAMASHDLRAPLHNMEGFAKALEEDHGPLLPPQAREWLGRIRTSAARLGGLIDSLLRLARTGQAVVARREVDLSALATEILGEWARQEPARKTEITIESGVCSLCDPTLARAVMENLLGNAWKYSSRKGKTVIRFGRDSSGWLFVADEGAGFDMAKSDGLFQSFQRLHRVDEFEGAGIGLATVRRILEHHDGAIRAQAQPGVGATFHFHFGDLRTSVLG